MAPKRRGAAAAGESAPGTPAAKRQRIHRPSSSHVEALKSLEEARTIAKVMLAEVRAKKKAQQKKRRDHMAKAGKLDPEDVITIAEMKGMAVKIEYQSPASSSTASPAKSALAKSPTMSKAMKALRNLLEPGEEVPATPPAEIPSEEVATD